MKVIGLARNSIGFKIGNAIIEYLKEVMQNRRRNVSLQQIDLKYCNVSQKMQDQIDSILKGDFTSESDRSYCIQPLGELKFPLGEFL